MGKVRTKTVKRASKSIVEKYYPKLTTDFHINKRIIDDIALIQTKRLRNMIAGYTTHLMSRIQKGPVKGISLKLQEEERDRKMDFVPEKSAIDTENINVDETVGEMLETLGLEIPGVNVVASDDDE
ncbi:unnamed protein product [Moneuplotes crassus]|uniref:40S ribosomal protein S17 n=1 Tax=Euplotes crassus TaxID=5936 RepID=A0A7S3NTU4_EUPCR|nr:unnamed protein product [Moneuplotes crassus]|mmetsp:Transcript_1662/g.1620  ORF Transcript_1662/g.1620 Transcript_1662/m.1620 type:complete len:126 (+) Transcript_1662:34-411(+)|eukprot:CAMPEP_0196994318 /NCGR_PEP_ID=MMETSP1380-20130617/627_1 /TAXON_ID=5936 /ORGANISM="Euplotes crassus, Strain CT5" /LENGTH=125 /DNA_ID=CAMNT_0042409655 /DNA_START=30 /DNA_END=407 /DNA_ORIENTATION=-